MITQFQSAHFPSNNITLYIRVFQINMLFSGKVWRTFNWAVGFNKSFPFGWRLIPIKNICFSLLLRGWRNVQVLELKFLKHFFLFLTSFRLAFGDWLIDWLYQPSLGTVTLLMIRQEQNNSSPSLASCRRAAEGRWAPAVIPAGPSNFRDMCGDPDWDFPCKQKQILHNLFVTFLKKISLVLVPNINVH